jgi:hypothetical protein
MRLRLHLLVVLLLFVATVAAAQDWWRRGFGGFRRVPPRFAKVNSFDGTFNFCRLMYTSVRREAGGQGWSTDYPDADINFSIRLSELTKTRVSREPTGDPNHLVVRVTDESLFQCPFVLMADAGTASLSDAEVIGLRNYLQKGGFLWADDFWGPRALLAWESELARVLPGNEYHVRDITPSHALFRAMFDVKSIPQIPSIQFWRQSGGQTSERGSDSIPAHMRGIEDRHGNLMVLMSHNTDISDAWEREGEDPQFFFSFSPDGYAIAINVVMYTMSH